MDVDFDQAVAPSNVDDWLARFSPVVGSRPGAFPFTSRKTRSIESCRARMSDLLILDVLLIRGGIRAPDMLFPPADWAALGKLLCAIDESVYDILKKDCLVYILLKWAWDMDPKDTNTGWDKRYVEDRCIAPQFVALADAYWFLDTGTHLDKAVSVLSDARLNRDYVSKILQALALSSSPVSLAGDTSPSAAALVVKYVRTAKPLLTEPDDIDLYVLSLAQLSFMDAWAYQKSFPGGSDTRERLLRKIVGWCLMPTPKQEPLAQLLSFPLSFYEQSSLHTLALPPHFSTSLSMSNVNATAPSDPALSSQAISVLQDLLCVRAIQSGDYVHAIKLDRQFSSVSPSLASSISGPSIGSQMPSCGRDAIDRKSIIQDLFATLPPAERTLLEDEIGLVATGVRANIPSPFTPKQGTSARRPPMVDMNLSASWEDAGTGFGSPTPPKSVSSSVIGTTFAGRATPVPVSTTSRVNQPSLSPFASHVAQPQPVSFHQPPPTPKFTAFGSPIPPTAGISTGRGVITERSKTLFSTSTTGGPSAAVKPSTRVSLFETAGSAKSAPNAFYKPPSAPPARVSLDVGSALASSSTARSAGEDMNTVKRDGKPQEGEGGGEDVSMGSRSDVEIIEESGGEEQDEHAGDFITYDKSGAADFTLHARHDDGTMGEEDEYVQELGFSVFSGSRNATQNSSANGQGKKGMSENGHPPHASPPPVPHVSRAREGDKLGTSVKSTATGRTRAPPGAFHREEDDEDGHGQVQNKNEGGREDEGEDDRVSMTTPISSPRRNAHTRTEIQTPSRPARAQSQRSSRSAAAPTVSRPSKRTGRTSTSKPSSNQTIPGALMDDDDDEHAQDDDHTDVHGDDDTEIDEHEDEDDPIAPLPSRSSRRTRSAGHTGASTATSTKSKPNATATGAKGKAKARPSEVKTPPRRSSRLSTASSISPDHNEVASPTKKGRKSTSSKAPAAGGATSAVSTRSGVRRKR